MRSRSNGNSMALREVKPIQVVVLSLPGFATGVFTKAEFEGVNGRAIYRAKEKLGIESDRTGGKAFWYIPGEKGDPTIKTVDASAYIPEEAIE